MLNLDFLFIYFMLVNLFQVCVLHYVPCRILFDTEMLLPPLLYFLIQVPSLIVFTEIYVYIFNLFTEFIGVALVIMFLLNIFLIT